MAGAPGMHQQGGIGQRLHQSADTTGVVQVHVGGNHKLHLARLNTPLFQKVQDDGNGVVGSSFDDGVLAPPFQQVAGRQLVTDHPGIDTGDIVANVFVYLKSHRANSYLETGRQRTKYPTIQNPLPSALLYLR